MSDHEVRRLGQQVDVLTGQVTRKFAQTKARRAELREEIAALQKTVESECRRIKARLDAIEGEIIARKQTKKDA